MDVSHYDMAVRGISKKATPRAQGDGWLSLRESWLPQAFCIALPLCQAAHITGVIMRSRECPLDLSSGKKSYNKSPFVPFKMMRSAY